MRLLNSFKLIAFACLHESSLILFMIIFFYVFFQDSFLKKIIIEMILLKLKKKGVRQPPSTHMKRVSPTPSPASNITPEFQ